MRQTGAVIDRRFDLPSTDDESQPYWQASHDGRLLLRRCLTCDAVHHYPRPFCPSCWSDRVEWIEASGQAVLYTYSVVFQNDLPPFVDQVPYVAAVVELAEGPRVVTQVVGCETDELEIGMALTATFRPLDDDITIVVFEPSRR